MHHLRYIASKIPYYMPLFGILVLTMLVFFSFPNDRSFQKAVVVSSALSYVVWGIIYHILHRDLSGVVILEYVAIAALGVASVLSIF